jgi:hypothetical protein
VLAVEHGWLETVQVQQILIEQRHSRPKIGQLLVSIRALDRETLEKELAMYIGK